MEQSAQSATFYRTKYIENYFTWSKEDQDRRITRKIDLQEHETDTSLYDDSAFQYEYVIEHIGVIKNYYLLWVQRFLKV